MLKHARQTLAHWLGEAPPAGMNTASPTLSQYQAYFTAYPLASLLPYEAYDETRSLFINRQSVGFVLDAAPVTGISEESLTIMARLLADNLPDGVALQCLLIASPYIHPMLQPWQAVRTKQGGVYATLANARIHYLQQGAWQALQRDSMLVRDFQLLLSASLPIASSADIDPVAQRLITLRDALLNACRAISLTAQPISSERFLSVLHTLVNPTLTSQAAQPPWDKNTSLNLQIADAENRLRITPDSLILGEDNLDIRCLSVKACPTTWAQWGMQDLIGDVYRDTLRLPCPFLLHWLMVAPPRDKLTARAHVKRLRTDQQARSPLARFIPSLQQTQQDWAFVSERLQAGDRLVEGLFQVILYAKPHQGPLAEMAAKNLFAAKGFTLRKDKFLALPAWLTCLPMNLHEGLLADLRRLGRLRTWPTFTATQLMPLQGEWKGMSHPRLLLTGRRGQVLWWDNFANNEGNYNVAVVGKSGSGKSVFMQELLVSLVGSGGRVWVMDVGRSFAKTCHVLGGTFIEFTPESNVCINPFTFIQDFTESLHLLKPLIALMAKPTTAMTDHENALIEQALKAAWQQAGTTATLTHVANWLCAHADNRAHDLGISLFPYTKDGMYARFFEGRCTLETANSLVVLELEELKGKKDLQAVVLLSLMLQVTEAMVQGNRQQPLACIIDEAWDLLRGAQSGEFVEMGCRRARKYNGAFITGTQSIHDYYKTPAAQAAIENSDWLCLLSQKPESIDELKERKRLSLDGYHERLLKSLKTIQGEYAEIAIIGPPGFAVGQLVLDPFSRILYSSKSTEFAAVQTLQQQGYTLMEAIEQVAAKLK